jgi:hypothetical protein
MQVASRSHGSLLKSVSVQTILAAGLALIANVAAAAEPGQPRLARATDAGAHSVVLRRCPGCRRFHAPNAPCPGSGELEWTEPQLIAPQPPVPSAEPLEAPAPPADAGANATPTPDSLPAPAQLNQPSADMLASNFGAASAPQSTAPFMIGDSFGAGGTLVIDNTQGLRDSYAIPTGGGGGPMKIADNSSPLPRCRAFMNYNYFSRAIRNDYSGPGGLTNYAMNVNRYTFGWEQCFADSQYSIEVRVPFSSTLGTEQTLGNQAVLANEFGHVITTFKALLLQTDTWAVTGGLAINLPTSNNFRVFSPGQPGALTQQYQVNDQSIHLQPFLGYIATPNDKWFVQAFAQLDFDTRGNDVSYYDPQSQTFPLAGIVQDQSLLFLDASIGYWLYNDQNKTRGITGIAPLVELHYTTTLQNADIISSSFSSSRLTYGNLANRIDVLNMTAGLTIVLGQNSYFTLAGTAPMNDFPNRFFNGEGIALYNWFF